MREEEERLEITSFTPSEEYVDFIENGDGIYFAADANSGGECSTLKPETFPLAKWIKQNRPSLKVEIELCDKHISLRSNEYWIPLIFLASDVALPLFVSALYDYLKDKGRGILSGEQNKVHLKIVRKKGKNYEEINYFGPVEGLEKLKEIDNG